MNQKRISKRAFLLALLIIAVSAIAVISYSALKPTPPPQVNNKVDYARALETIRTRIDRELVNAKTIPISDTFLTIKIPVSYTLPIDPQMLTTTPFTSNVVALTDKESDQLQKTQNCINGYHSTSSINTSFSELDCRQILSGLSEEQRSIYTSLRTKHDFFIQIINTPLTPEEWVLDNVIYQGVKLRDQPQNVSRGTTHTINGRNYLAVGVSCCGGYEMNYFTRSTDTHGSTVLVKFGTHDINGKISDEDNTVLDQILATISPLIVQ